MPSKNRRISSGSGSVTSPSDHTISVAPSRSTHPIATTRCKYSGAKSPPLAARRKLLYHARTSQSANCAGTPWTRRIPSTSGIVSMSKTRIGIMRERRERGLMRVQSRRKNAGREITVAAIADDEHDRRVFKLARDPQRDSACAARRDAAKEALFAREPARHVFRFALRHIFDAVDAGGVENFRQIGGWPLADSRNLRTLFGLRADDRDGAVLLFEKFRN